MPSNVNMNNNDNNIDNINNNVNNNDDEGSNTKLIGTIVLLIASIFGGIVLYNKNKDEVIIGESLQQEEKELTENIESEDSLKVSTTENNQILLIESIWWQDYLISFAIFIGVFLLMIFVPISPLRLNHEVTISKVKPQEPNIINNEKLNIPPGDVVVIPLNAGVASLNDDTEITSFHFKKHLLQRHYYQGDIENEKTISPLINSIRRWNILKGSVLYFFHSLIYVFCYLLIFSLILKFRTSYSFGDILKNVFFHALSMKNYYVIWNVFLVVLGFLLYVIWFGSVSEKPFGIEFLSKRLPAFPNEISFIKNKNN